MKRMVTLLLVLCLILSGCSSGTTEQTTTAQAETTTEAAAEAVQMTLAQFEDKYKRASWEDDFIANFDTFILDYKRSFDLEPEQWCPDFSDFEKEEDDYGIHYKKDIVLFNKAFRLSVTVDDEHSLFTGGLYYYGDAEECYSAFIQIIDSLIAAEGDPKEFKINDNVVSEAEYRKAAASGFVKEDVRASWNYETSKSGENINIWCYNIAKGTMYMF